MLLHGTGPNQQRAVPTSSCSRTSTGHIPADWETFYIIFYENSKVWVTKPLRQTWTIKTSKWSNFSTINGDRSHYLFNTDIALDVDLDTASILWSYGADSLVGHGASTVGPNTSQQTNIECMVFKACTIRYGVCWTLQIKLGSRTFIFTIFLRNKTRTIKLAKLTRPLLNEDERPSSTIEWSKPLAGRQGTQKAACTPLLRIHIFWKIISISKWPSTHQKCPIHPPTQRHITSSHVHFPKQSCSASLSQTVFSFVWHN